MGLGWRPRALLKIGAQNSQCSDFPVGERRVMMIGTGFLGKPSICYKYTERKPRKAAEIAQDEQGKRQAPRPTVAWSSASRCSASA